MNAHLKRLYKFALSNNIHWNLIGDEQGLRLKIIKSLLKSLSKRDKMNRLVRYMYIDLVDDNNSLEALYNDLSNDFNYITKWGVKWYKWVGKYGNWVKQ